MDSMFNFLEMVGDYKDRCVDRFEQEGLLVSTCEITDSDQPFETAVAHPPPYNCGKIITVQLHESLAEAQDGHDKWVKIMTSEVPPESLSDVGTSEIKKAMNGGIRMVFPKS